MPGWPSTGLAQGEGASPSVPLVAASDLPRDLSPWGMFLSADPLVKAVLIGLALASVVTWTVWLAKSVELLVAKRRARRAAVTLASARHLGDAAQPVREASGPARQV